MVVRHGTDKFVFRLGPHCLRSAELPALFVDNLTAGFADCSPTLSAKLPVSVITLVVYFRVELSVITRNKTSFGGHDSGEILSCTPIEGCTMRSLSSIYCFTVVFLRAGYNRLVLDQD